MHSGKIACRRGGCCRAAALRPQWPAARAHSPHGYIERAYRSTNYPHYVQGWTHTHAHTHTHTHTLTHTRARPPATAAAALCRSCERQLLRGAERRLEPRRESLWCHSEDIQGLHAHAEVPSDLVQHAARRGVAHEVNHEPVLPEPRSAPAAMLVPARPPTSARVAARAAPRSGNAYMHAAAAAAAAAAGARARTRTC